MMPPFLARFARIPKPIKIMAEMSNTTRKPATGSATATPMIKSLLDPPLSPDCWPSKSERSTGGVARVNWVHVQKVKVAV